MGNNSSDRGMNSPGGCRKTGNSYNDNYTFTYNTSHADNFINSRKWCYGCMQKRENFSGSACYACVAHADQEFRERLAREEAEAESRWRREKAEAEARLRREKAEAEARLRREKAEAEARLREEQELQHADEEFVRIEQQNSHLNNYIPENLEQISRKKMKPYAYWNNKWAEIDYEILLVHQHKKRNSKRIYVWKYCKIECKAKRHLILEHDESNWPDRAVFTSTFEQVLQSKECPNCKKEKDAVNAKINDFETKQENISNLLQTSNSENIKLSDITQLQSDLNKLFDECKNDIKDVDDIVKDSKSIAEEEEMTPTIETKIDLEKFLKKAASGQDKISRQKRKLFKMEKEIQTGEIAILNDEKKMTEDLINERENKMQLNKYNENVDQLQKELRELMQNKCVQDVVCNEVQQLNGLFDQLLQLLHDRYVQNEKRLKELDECNIRLGTIRAKLEAQKGNNKYLLELLDEEYNRLTTAKQSAMKKFEQNGVYFLAVTVGLKEDIIDKFVEFGCDKLDDIKGMNDEDLQEIGVESNLMRKKILKQIQIFNEKFQENDKKAE